MEAPEYRIAHGMTESRKLHDRTDVCGVSFDPVDWDDALDIVSTWAARRESRYVCFSNVHSVHTASQNAEFDRVLRDADLVCPDGMPIVWALRRLGHPQQARINGPDFMWRFCEHAALEGRRIYLYGSTTQTLEALARRLERSFPGLSVAGTYSPPFRPLDETEVQEIIENINAVKPEAVFVGLGCPKQEIWMRERRGQIDAVMLGVGAAFDYHAGTLRRAPLWMQRSGLEWLYRFVTEPRRLWRRYLVTNAYFVSRLWRERGRRKSVDSSG